MRSHTLLATLLPLLAAASPLVERAGGPTSEPIPATCTVINSLPQAACGTSNVNGYKPDLAFVKANLVYQAYFDSGLSQADDAKQCEEQCYGFGTAGTCKSSFVGYQIPTPKGYMGTAGGQLETGCLLFKEYLTPLDFVLAPIEGRYLNATAASIYCPS
jgi:hypothetical protein